MLLEDTPEVGRIISLDEFSFEITEMDRNRISRVLVNKVETEES